MSSDSNKPEIESPNSGIADESMVDKPVIDETTNDEVQDEQQGLNDEAMDQDIQAQPSRCGFAAIVGRPNVGKSTLLNQILGQKLSITCRKPQTTRHQILGIHTEGNLQVVYVDTPGMHKQEVKAINRFMNKTATNALKDVDVIVFLVDKQRWTDEDEWVLEKLKRASCPVILAVNKVDQIAEKGELLPYLNRVSEKMDFSHIIPISAKQGHNVDRLQTLVEAYIPESVHYYEEDQLTDRSQRFLAAEMVREKIMRQLGEEVPYSIAVEIEEFAYDERGVLHVSALILVERQGQKKIVIGDKGAQIKIIGRDARLEMERFFEAKVMLNLWVKVKGGWADSERALKSLGYDDQ